MSGGHFTDCGYDYYKLAQFADELESEIQNNNTKNEYEYAPEYSSETVEYLSKQVKQMRLTAEIMRHIDYLYSGDHGEDSFMVRVKETEKRHEENEEPAGRLDQYEDGFFGRNTP